MSDHTDTTLTDTERDSLTECECGHYLNEHVSGGCLATVYDGDDGMASLDDVCACMATPDLIRERAIVAIVAAHVAAARADERAKMAKRLAPLVDSARVALSGPPIDCTNACMDGPCDCSGNFRALAWDIDPHVLRALIEGADQ